MTKPVRITAEEVHDGLGGVHKRGDVVEFERELADLIVSKGMGVVLGDGDYRAEIARADDMAKARDAANRAADLKAQAERRMRVYDELPSAVREMAQEHGDEVVDEFLKPDDPLEQILDAAEPKRKRGLPR